MPEAGRQPAREGAVEGRADDWVSRNKVSLRERGDGSPPF